jgi:hypothetical protein
MTSFRQIEANRRNAIKSTGPNTEEGKHQSRKNAVRHGLCAETVAEIVEDIDDYKGFEAAVIADFDAQTAVERELVLRLASLLWRLRRATAIDTDLLRLQAEILRERRSGHHLDRSANSPSDFLERATCSVQSIAVGENGNNLWQSERDLHCRDSRWVPQSINRVRELTLSFQRVANLDTAVFERLGHYESALARQVMKTLFLLRSVRAR